MNRARIRVKVTKVFGKETSNSYLGICPFHDEVTPSFFVRKDLGTYKCYGCGASGYNTNLDITFKEVSA